MRRYFKIYIIIILILFGYTKTINALVVQDAGAASGRLIGAYDLSSYSGGYGGMTIGKHAACMAISRLGATYSQGLRYNSCCSDCSQLVWSSYMKIGIVWGPTPASSINNSTSRNQSIYLDSKNLRLNCEYLQPGDLLFWQWDDSTAYYGKNLYYNDHVTMYVGNNTMVEASSSKGMVSFFAIGERGRTTKYLRGCFRPYTRQEELEYERKYRNSKTITTGKYHQAFGGNNDIPYQTTKIEWEKWGCNKFIGPGGKVNWDSYGGLADLYKNANLYYDKEGGTMASKYYLRVKLATLKHVELLKGFKLIQEEQTCKGLLGSVDDSKTPAYWLQLILSIIKYLAVGLLLLLSSFDLAKAITSAEENDAKKAIMTTLKRIAYTIILFMLPSLINMFFGVIGVYGNEYNKKCVDMITEGK